MALDRGGKLPFSRNSDMKYRLRRSFTNQMPGGRAQLNPRSTLRNGSRTPTTISEASKLSHEEPEKPNVTADPIPAPKNHRLFSPQPAAKKRKIFQKRVFSAQTQGRVKKSQKFRKAVRKCFSPLSERIRVTDKDDRRHIQKLEKVKNMLSSFSRISETSHKN